MKKLVTPLIERFTGLDAVMNRTAFAAKVYDIYSILDGFKNEDAAKLALVYASKENEVSWCYVLDFLGQVIKEYDHEGYRTAKDNLDWQSMCENSDNKVIQNIMKKTKFAFKVLAMLVACNNGLNLDDMLAEEVIKAYGWDKAARLVVAAYEEILRAENPTTTVLAQADKQEKTSNEAMDTKDAAIIKEKASDCGLKKKEDVAKPKRTNDSKCKPVIQIMADGSIKEWGSISIAAKETGIKHCSISKCVNGIYQAVKNPTDGTRCRFCFKDDYTTAA